MRYLLIIYIILSFGCYSEKKAQKQVHKALDEFPLSAAKEIRDRFPCVSKDTNVTIPTSDSSDYLTSIDEARHETELFKNSLDSALRKLKSLPQEVSDACGDYEEIIDSLYAENTRFALQLDHIKPVIKHEPYPVPTEDKAKTKILEDNAAAWKDLYLKDHEFRIKRESAEKGNFTLYLPKWVVIVIGLLIIIIIYLKLKYFKK